MLQMDWLANHMIHSDTFAGWLHCQFSYEYDQPLEVWQREFAEGQSNEDWKTLVFIEDGELQGGAALARHDLDLRPDLGPWLACVFVEPQARGQGLAEQLIEGICSHARETGVSRLYLHTHDRSDYYAQRGWTIMERFEAWGKEQWLMSRELN